MKHEPLRASLWLGIHQGSRLLLGIFLLGWMARELGPEQFGLYNTLITYAWIAQLLASMGASSPLFLEIVKAKHSESALLGAAFWLNLMGLLPGLAFFSGAVFLSLMGNPDTWILATCLLPLLLYPLFENLHHRWVALGQAARSGFWSWIAYICNANLVALALYFQAPLWLLLCTFWTEFALLSGFLWFTNRQISIDWKQGWVLVPEFLKISIPVLGSTFLLLIFQRLPLISVDLLSSTQETGWISGAQRLAGLIPLLPMILLTPLYAQVADSWENHPQNFEKLLHKTARWTLFAAWPAVLLCTLAAGPLCLWILGPSFAPAESSLMWLAAGSLILGLRALFDKMLTLWNQPWLCTQHYGLLIVLGFLLSAFWIPQEGSSGGAKAWTIALWLSLGFTWLDPRTRKLGAVQWKALCMPWK